MSKPKAPIDAQQELQKQDEVTRLKRRIAKLEEENDIFKNTAGIVHLLIC